MDELRKIVCLALIRSPEDRPAYLDVACKNDPALRAEAQAWVHALKRSQPPDTDCDSQSLLQHWLQTGSLCGYKLGPYLMEDEIGRGGMGLIYRARRYDNEFRQQVAIKIMLPNSPPDLLPRFLAERNILANLNHPYIARLYDGGSHEGQPYFVMEYVDGEPIDVYCNRNNLSITQRIELFLKVLDAIQYAHQCSLVHRDLKPANILVSKSGVPKLLDFGIAELAHSKNRQLASSQLDILRTMTREYASPEQIKQHAVTPAADIYALGVLLYKLLTGFLPYRLERRTPSQLERAVCKQEPEAPSQALASRRLKSHHHNSNRGRLLQTSDSLKKHRRRLRGDLDQIVLKAMRKEPGARYVSAAEFAKDLHNYLNSLPVSACEDERCYRTKKWLVRNRHYLGFEAAVSLTILTFAILSAGRKPKHRLTENDESTRGADELSSIAEMFS